jgi:hypothetical protein
MNTQNYNTEVVSKVAQAIIDCEPELHESRSDYRICQFCGCTQGVSYVNGREKNSGKFPHALDCPVLVAQDLLTVR